MKMAGRKAETGQTPAFTEAISVKEPESGVKAGQMAEPESEAAESRETKKEKSWMVIIPGNPDYCGVGAGGIQFANGQALIKSGRMAEWFKEHKGYKVIGR